MARLFTDFIKGTTDATLTSGATTLSGAILASLPAVSGGDTQVLVLDPEAQGNGPELVTVTAHTASATTATVTRTKSVEHASGTVIIQAVTEELFDDIEAHITGTHAADTASHIANTSNPHSVTPGQIGAADASHVGSGGAAHADATTGADGFMSAADKTSLDALVAEDPKANQTIVAGDALTGGGSGDSVTINHEDTSTATSVISTGDDNKWITAVSVDGYGHVTGLGQAIVPLTDWAETESDSIVLGTSEANELTVTFTGLDSSRIYELSCHVTLTAQQVSGGAYIGARAKIDTQDSYLSQSGNQNATATPCSVSAHKVATVTSKTSVSCYLVGVKGASGTVGGTISGQVVASIAVKPA